MGQLFRWSGAVVFVLSLLSMPAMYLIRLRAPAAEAATIAAVLTNIVLFTVFAVHHSIMARSGAKAWLMRMVPPDLERTTYVWISSVLFLGVTLLWQPLPGMVWQVRGPGIILFLIQLFGVALTVRAAQIVGVRELAGLRQPDPAKQIEFTADGPYGIVRHPIYLGWVLIVFFTPTMTTSQLLFAVVSTIYLAIAIPFEERSLVAAFGNRYTAYQRQVQWRLIPGLW